MNEEGPTAAISTLQHKIR